MDPGPHLARPPRRAARHADVDARRPPTRSSPATWVGDVALEGVRFAYSPDAPEALRGVDLHISAGQRVALVGTTGAGKSTFVKLVARFYDPTAGRVLVDGNDLRDVGLHGYRRRLGYVPQEPFLFSGTIRSNIAYGRPDATDLEIERAARAVGAHDLVRRSARRLPHRRSPRPAARCPPGSASCCAWPGPSSSTRRS